uniref:Uncharacterized protein n=1 Tax=uncultured marine thaumarchaeote KM3_56_F06 TaxID=1456204 RepID=A0A075HE04_9ARCH|nr:hypothetical protein [uncultured marine thaumarchaeote KM3_56_F06]
MGDSETFGVEKGNGAEVVSWLNEQAKLQSKKLEARLYGHTITTENFGEFEMFSWIGDVQNVRKMIIKASKRFKVKVIEGGYKPKEKMIKMKKFDFAKVKKGDKTIGQIQFVASRFGNKNWEIQDEERH